MLLFVRSSPISETITKLDFEKNKNTCILYLHIKKSCWVREYLKEKTRRSEFTYLVSNRCYSIVVDMLSSLR